MTQVSRRTALQAGAALGLGLAGLGRTATAQEPVKLRMSHFLSPMAPIQTKLFAPWAERVEKDSGGRIKCEIYPAMQLGGKPPQLFDQARTGVAPSSFSASPTGLVGRRIFLPCRSSIFVTSLSFMWTRPGAWQCISSTWTSLNSSFMCLL